MSSAVLSTSAAQGRFFVFDAEVDSGFSCHPERSGKCEKRISRGVEGPLGSANPRLAGIVAASHLGIRPAAEMISSGIAAIDSLAGGLPRGCLTEIFGSASSGRTTILLAALAAATRRGEVCAVVDAGDALDPQSAAAAGIELDRLLWVRCAENPPQSRSTEKTKSKVQSRSQHHDENGIEQLLRAADLLLESGGFGLIALDLCDLPPQTARRIPLTTWFRFRRAVEHTPTVLLVFERQSIAGSCSSLLIKLGAAETEPAAEERKKPTHARLFTGLEITAEIIRSRIDRKPAVSASATFTGKTAWAG
jgi:hypothetical protein